MTTLEERVTALEAAVADLTRRPEPEPDFMSEVETKATWSAGAGVSLRITHLPTGVTVEAPARPEAIAKLGEALDDHRLRLPPL